MTKATVGIPFRNAERTLADAIRSVFAQSMTTWELILADDGSEDSSFEIARAVQDPRVRLLSDGRHMGLPCRLNQISSLARGDYLIRMDADDLMHPRRIERQIEFLDANPAVDAIDTLAYTIDSSNRITGMKLSSALDTRPVSILKHGLFCHPTVAGRTEWFLKHPYDERFRRAEDYELWCRTCRTSNFCRLDESLHYYREGHREDKKYLRYYLEDAKFCRLCLSIHGPAAAGRLVTAMLMARLSLKTRIFQVYTMLGRQRALVNKRHRPLDSWEFPAAAEGLDVVMRTEVPGLSNRTRSKG